MEGDLDDDNGALMAIVPKFHEESRGDDER